MTGARAIHPFAAPLDRTVTVPGSKSHTNRALITAALAGGRSRLSGALFANDTEAMQRSLSALGVGIEADRDAATIIVDGGLDRFRSGPLSVDVAQSGTTGRFLLALATLGPGPYVIDGDPQLQARPMGPLVAALGSLGADITPSDDGPPDRLPLLVRGGGQDGGPVELGGSVSSQFLSALLLAAPGARTAVEIALTDELVSKPYIDLTIATMASFGVGATNDDYRRFTVAPQAYEPQSISIEPDASAASYFFAAAAVTGGRVRIDGLGTSTVQGDLRFVQVLEQMGAEVDQGPDWTEVAGTGRLDGIDVDLSDLSDTAQTLAVVATFASTPTSVTGIGFIEAKEIPRVSAVVAELNALGISATKDDDGFTIHPGSPRPGVVTTSDDHRMAMSFALLGLVHPGIEIDDPGCVAKTFPRFFDVLDGLAR